MDKWLNPSSTNLHPQWIMKHSFYLLIIQTTPWNIIPNWNSENVALLYLGNMNVNDFTVIKNTKKIIWLDKY